MKKEILVMAASMSIAIAEPVNIIEMMINDEEIFADYYARYLDTLDFDLEEEAMMEAIKNACPYPDNDEESEQ
jgi:hypothetical protein